MLTEEEKKMAAARAMARVDQEAHEAEIRAYEQAIADDARMRQKVEDAKTNVLPDVNALICGCGVVAVVGGIMIFKRLAMDLTFDYVTLWCVVVGLSSLCLLGKAFELVDEGSVKRSAGEKKDAYENRAKMRNRRRGVQRLAVAVFGVAMFSLALPCAYVHCPLDAGFAEKGLMRANDEKRLEAEYATWKSELDKGRCNPFPLGKLYFLREDERAYKSGLTWMFWITSGLSVVAFAASWKLRNSALT